MDSGKKIMILTAGNPDVCIWTLKVIFLKQNRHSLTTCTLLSSEFNHFYGHRCIQSTYLYNCIMAGVSCHSFLVDKTMRVIRREERRNIDMTSPLRLYQWPKRQCCPHPFPLETKEKRSQCMKGQINVNLSCLCLVF